MPAPGTTLAKYTFIHLQTKRCANSTGVARSLLGNPVKYCLYLEMTVAHVFSLLKKTWFALFPLESGAYRFERGLVIRARKP